MAIWNRNKKTMAERKPKEVVGFSQGSLTGRVQTHIEGLSREGAEVAGYARDLYPALSTPAGVQAVRLITSTIANLPVVCENNRGSRTKNPIWVERPNPKFPEIDFACVISHIVSSLVLEGIAYVGLRRNGTGQVVGLVLPEPSSVAETATQEANPKRVFSVEASSFSQSSWTRGSSPLWDKEVNGVGQQFKVEDMLIWLGGVAVPGSLRGISPFDLISDTLGIARAVQKYAHEHYELYAHNPSVFLMRQGALSNEQKEELERDYKEQMTGRERGRPKALFTQQAPAQDAVFAQPGQTAKDVSVTDISGFAMSQIAMAADVPLALIGGATAGGSSYNSLQIQKQHWINVCVVPMAQLVEKVFGRILPEGHKLKLDVSELAKGDIQTISQVARELVRLGVIKGNEARDMLGLEESGEKGSDMLMVDGNRVPLKEAVKPKPKPVQAPPVPPGGKPPAPPSAPAPDENPGGDAPENQPTSPQPEGRPPGS